MTDKTIFLCPDCAALYAESYTVEVETELAGRKTCEGCKRRSLGGMYRVRKGDKP